jgi:hypothetical protein
MGDGIAVNLDALTTFAHNLGKVADDAQTEWKDLSQNMANNSMDVLRGGMNSVVTGNTTIDRHPATNFSESSAFARYHGVVAYSAVQFITDAFKGAASLGAGAEFCAINYADTDALNAKALHGIQGISKDGGFTSLNFAMSGTANISGDNVNGAFAPKDGDGLFTTGNSGGAADPKDPKGGKQPAGQGGDPDAAFKDKLDEQRKAVTDQKIPDTKPDHTRAPDTSDMPFPDDTPHPHGTGSTLV